MIHCSRLDQLHRLRVQLRDSWGKDGGDFSGELGRLIDRFLDGIFGRVDLCRLRSVL